MKRIFSFLFAILFAVGTTGVFTSCQEDAPEITINITMNNDFSDVVNAINNGTMKQEAAIAALTAAIEKMQGDQDSKQQTIADAINSLASTLDAKLAIIEAAMKAQTLALETKFDLLEAAIKALPDYSDQLEAIAAAVEAIPDYSNKLAALETALEAIAENIEAQEGQYADELAALTEAIDAIKSEVAAGNKSQDEALAEIIALLESGAIAGGGSGSGGEGSGGEGGEGEGGEGGEGSGGEGGWTYESITITTNKLIGETIVMTVQGELAASEVEGAFIKNSETNSDGTTEYTFELTDYTVTIKQASIAYIDFTFDQITSVDLNCSELKSLKCYMNEIRGENMTNLVKDLPDRTGKTAGKFMVYATDDSRERNVITKADVAIAKAKNWNVICWNSREYEGI